MAGSFLNPMNDLEREPGDLEARTTYIVWPPGTVAGLRAELARQEERIAELEARVKYLCEALDEYDQEGGWT